MRGFMFAVVFIVIFATLLASVPAGLQGVGSSPSDVIPIDPNITTDFVSGENYTKSAFTYAGGLYAYEYSLNNKDWMCVTDEVYFVLSAKVYIWFLWLGHTDSVNFVSSGGEDRGNQLTFTEIDSDATDGTARYTLTHVISGEAAGGFIAYWNTTAYATSTLAWDNDALYLIHGVGFTTTATNDIGALIVGLLFLQLPNVPVLINVFIVVPLWACIIYVLWFIIKEMIPFV